MLQPFIEASYQESALSSQHVNKKMLSALNPQTPDLYVENETDAYSVELEQFVVSKPACIIRRLAPVVKLDLGLFSSKTLVLAHPDHRVEIRTQNQQTPHEAAENKTWHCESSRSHTTIARYAEYQVTSYSEAQRENDEAPDKWKEFKDNDDDSSSMTTKNARRKVIKFGTNVDLSDQKKWKRQLDELNKLPAFTRVECETNMLSHMGHTILGVNSVQLYMKVPGSRTPGHQENSNFCSINLNIGPGDCEWYCVAEPYWMVLSDLCREKGINYLRGSWWPDIEDLQKKNIPLYRFRQKPGDLVWIGPGTIHWVQALGWCNNVAWNVGPFTHQQYKTAIDRCDYYRLEHYQAIIPMSHLSWNLARTAPPISDRELSSELQAFLGRSLEQCNAALQCASRFKRTVIWHGRVEGEAALYCEHCLIEVFNILFTMISMPDKKHFVYCKDCALEICPTLCKVTVLQQYEMKDLQQIYDSLN